jgi:hypothetical protein
MLVDFDNLKQKKKYYFGKESIRKLIKLYAVQTYTYTHENIVCCEAFLF